VGQAMMRNKLQKTQQLKKLFLRQLVILCDRRHMASPDIPNWMKQDSKGDDIIMLSYETTLQTHIDQRAKALYRRFSTLINISERAIFQIIASYTQELVVRLVPPSELVHNPFDDYRANILSLGYHFVEESTDHQNPLTNVDRKTERVQIQSDDRTRSHVLSVTFDRYRYWSMPITVDDVPLFSTPHCLSCKKNHVKR